MLVCGPYYYALFILIRYLGILNDRLTDHTYQRPSPAETLTGEANIPRQNNISNTPKHPLDPRTSQHLVSEKALL